MTEITNATEDQRSKMLATLEWEVRGPFGSQVYLLRAWLDTQTLLYFGELRYDREKYRIAYKSKPDGVDLLLFSTDNKKATLQRSFVVMVQMGIVVGMVHKVPTALQRVEELSPDASVKINGEEVIKGEP